MRAKTADVWTYLCIVTVFGIVRGVDISFNEPKDGFFLKSAYQKFRTMDPQSEKEVFILTQPSELYKLRAHHGPFEVYQSVADNLLEGMSEQGDNLNLMHRQIVFNTDMSAHIVTDKLTPKWPLLQVLLHAQPLESRKGDGLYNVYGYDQRWCGQLYVEHQHQQLSAVCTFTERNSACVMGVHIPAEWWHHNNTEVSVYYHVSRDDENHECGSASNSIVPGRSASGATVPKKTYISTIRLAEKEFNYEIRKDQNLIFHVPMQEFFPGAKFNVPVYLDTASKLQVIVIKVKVRNGLLIRGAVVSEDSPWSIYVETSDRQRSASVTAFIEDSTKLATFSRSQEIFHWQFEVEDSIMSPENGRIIWTIDYEKNAPSLNSYYPPRNSRVTARIRIAGRYHERIVPVFKETEILNTAILNGEKLSFPLQVFAVNDIGTFRDVTVLTACHSTDREVLKVSPDCSEIYFDGNETHGSHNVTVIAKTGLYTDNFYVRVWVPESRLDIQLSDNRLGQIRGWKVPSASGRSKRSVDFGLLTHSGFHISDRSPKLDRHGCQLRLQQAVVEVFTRFHIQSRSRIDYYRNRKAYLKVTDIVQKRMRMSDPRVASLHGNIIQGLGQGRAEIQVVSSSGRVMADREVRVGKEKVVMERLLIRVISSVRLEITPEGSLPGTLTAVAHLEDRIMSKHQEASLDVSVQFSDGTNLPLRYIDPRDYDLIVTTMNHHVIDVPKEDQLKIRAVGEGSGELVKVLFRLGDQCPRKRSRPLATNYVYVDVDFSKESNYLDSLQSDGNYNNRASGRWDEDDDDQQLIQKIHIDSKDKHQNQPKSKFDKIAKKDNSGPHVIPLDRVFNDLPEQKPKTEAHQQPISKNDKDLSPLEIGMYVLLAVFCVAILVFTVNCVVFMLRYRLKRIPKGPKDTVSQAHDWVWIGRSTLERNGANHTRCSQTLMPEEDFNGNQMIVRPQSGSHSSNSSQNGSNRNSTVSTYKGSECSIRITANPLLDGSDAPNPEDAEWDYEAMGMTYDQLMEYFDNLKESTA